MRRGLIAVLATVAPVAVGLAGARAYVGVRFSAESLAREIESRYTCRAEVGEVEVALFRRVPRLVARDVVISPEAGGGVPEQGPGRTGLKAREVGLTAEFWPLLAGDLQVTSIVLRDAVAETVVGGDGESSLNDLFEERPDDAERRSTATATAAAGSRPAMVFVSSTQDGVDATAAVDGEGDGEGERDGDRRRERQSERDRERDPRRAEDAAPEPGGFHARSLSLPPSLRRLEIEGGTVSAYLEKPRAFLKMLDIAASAREIAIDADDLARRNRAAVDFTGLLVVEDGAESARLAELALAVSGDIAPFDPANGYLNPEQVYPITMGKGSAVETFPLFEQLSGSLESLEKAGIKLDRLKHRAVLQEDAAIPLKLGHRRVELAGDAVFPFADYSLTLAGGSWVRGSDNRHQFAGNILASEELTREALDGLEEVVGDQVGRIAGESIGEKVASLARELLVEPLLDDGRVSLDFRSIGKLSDPKVKVDNKLRDLRDAAKDALKRGAVGDLLKGLLGQ